MNISIRNSIKNNFKDSDIDEIMEAVNSSINDKEEIALPGLGVFFEVLWKNSNDNDKKKIADVIKKNL